MRVPSGGRFPMSGRTVIHPKPDFGRRRKLPTYVAPCASSTSSPGCASSRARCRSPPAGTRIWRPVAGTYRVLTYARGISAIVPVEAGGNGAGVGDPADGGGVVELAD